VAVINSDLLIERWVDAHPDGAVEARIVDHGVEIWALVGYARGVDGDIREVARAYELPVEAVEAALAYYARHPSLIDAHLEINSEAYLP
jgi:uncharacterized protein (DUF433 family)